MAPLTDEERNKRLLSLGEVIRRVTISRVQNYLKEEKLHSTLNDMCLYYLQTGVFLAAAENTLISRTFTRSDLDSLHNLYEILPLWAKLQLDPLITEWRLRMYGDPDEKVQNTTAIYSANVYPVAAYEENIPVDVVLDSTA